VSDSENRLRNLHRAAPSIIESFKGALEEINVEGMKDALAYEGARLEDLLGEDKFVGPMIPNMPINDFVDRCVKYSKCEPACVVGCALYLKRIVEKGVPFHSLNVHRLTCVALALACKYFQDCYPSNAYFAKLLGLPLKDFNRAELLFLTKLDFDLAICESEFNALASVMETSVVYPKSNP